MGATSQILESIKSFDLDLEGLSVLTELATGPFTCTPLIAAAANASHVVAVGKDSTYGTVEQATLEVSHLAKQLGVQDRITFVRREDINLLGDFNIVTNLGHLRPLDQAVLGHVSSLGCVCLMWEPWEFRAQDLDLDYCRSQNIPVIGTDESHPLIDTGTYLGLLAAKLLFDVQCPLSKCKVAVVGNPEFVIPIRDLLSSLGTFVTPWMSEGNALPTDFSEPATVFDAVLVALHVPVDETSTMLLRNFSVQGLSSDVPLVNISGITSDLALPPALANRVYPKITPGAGLMSMTTGALGDLPVIKLHAGGLRAGQEVCRALQKGATTASALRSAELIGFGRRLSAN